MHKEMKILFLIYLTAFLSQFPSAHVFFFIMGKALPELGQGVKTNEGSTQKSEWNSFRRVFIIFICSFIPFSNLNWYLNPPTCWCIFVPSSYPSLAGIYLKNLHLFISFHVPLYIHLFLLYSSHIFSRFLLHSFPSSYMCICLNIRYLHKLDNII